MSNEEIIEKALDVRAHIAGRLVQRTIEAGNAVGVSLCNELATELTAGLLAGGHLDLDDGSETWVAVDEPEPEEDAVLTAARIHDQAMALVRMREALVAAGVIKDQDGPFSVGYEYEQAWGEAVLLVAGGVA